MKFLFKGIPTIILVLLVAGWFGLQLQSLTVLEEILETRQHDTAAVLKTETIDKHASEHQSSNISGVRFRDTTSSSHTRDNTTASSRQKVASGSTKPQQQQQQQQRQQQQQPAKVTLPKQHSNIKKTVHWQLDPPKFIVVRNIASQGAGNVLHGLLAAHLVGEEFGRIVCLHSNLFLQGFLDAFEPVHPLAVKHCPTFWKSHPLWLQEDEDNPPINQIEILNFFPPPNECLLKEKLQGNETFLDLTLNTYPRWPSVPRDFIFEYYKPKQVLLDMLPYGNGRMQPPTTVVHLRMGDGLADVRKGLDDKSIQALGNLLPKGNSTYLVTNRVEWYHYFESNFGWSHPHWQRVVHSALRQKMKWGKPLERDFYANPHHWNATKLNYMQLFSDWYTLLIASKVYHTFSDFSLSAVHWTNTWSRTFDGIDHKTGHLVLMDESWVTDGVTKPLVERTVSEMNRCDVASHSVRAGIQAMKQLQKELVNRKHQK